MSLIIDKGKPTRIGTVVLLMLFLLLFALPQEASAESRIALVIGNGAYEAEGRLETPASDARLTADTLRSLDFELYGGQAYVNLSEKKMRRLIHDFSEELCRRAKPVVLFYYSGHGLQVGGRNYMIPVDADIRHEVDVESEGISIDVDVLGRMNLARTKINIIILDACRNNPFEKRIKALGRRKGLSDMRPEQGSIIAFAAEPGEVAYESGGQYSHFTEVLAGEMKVPGIEILKMFQRVRVAVNRRTNGEQTPVERNVLFEDFFFKPLHSSISVAGKKDEGARPKISYKEDTQVSEIGRDDVFIAYENGVVKDTKTGLEWFAGPDRYTDWFEAQSWIQKLSVAAGGWRMPTRKELRSLYKKGVGIDNWTPLLKIHGWYVWSREQGHASLIQIAWGFKFLPLGRGKEVLSRCRTTDGRALAVRSRAGKKDEGARPKISYKEDTQVSEIGRDDVFIAYENGVVKDTKTGLEWFAGPDRYTDWFEAQSWIQKLSVAAGGWRMPTRKELRSLYKKGVGIDNWTPLLKIHGWYVWSREQGHASLIQIAWGFKFLPLGRGKEVLSRCRTTDGRALAVRSRR